jgi:hypothetical protein
LIEHITLIPAYIDPGTGSLILQIVLGGIASAWFVLKLWGKKIFAFFGKKEKEENAE